MLIKTAHLNVWDSCYILYKGIVVLNLVFYTTRNVNGCVAIDEQ